MKFLTLLLMVLFCVPSFSQNPHEAYSRRAEQIRQEIWEAHEEAFQATTVPAAMNHESAVILAKAIEVVNSVGVVTKLRGPVPTFSYRTTVHNRVKINDKAALEHYSAIEYTKQWNQSFYYGFTKMFNKREGFIGVKIIRPDGGETIVNSGEEVLTQKEKKYTEGKLAVSGLAVGDIIDYYIRIETAQEGFTPVQGPYTFMMGDEYPILYYTIKFQLNPSAGVKYINANGAPPFAESSNENNDLVLRLTQTNIPKFKSSYLISAPRQIPYLKLAYKLVEGWEDITSDYDRGRVKQGFSIESVINEYKAAIRRFPSDFGLNPLAMTKAYFGNPKKMRDVPQDSLVKVLYNAWRYNTFYFFPTDDIDISHELNNRYARSINSAVTFSKMLDQLGIANQIYLVASRYSGSWENTLNLSELSALIKITEPRQYWLAFDDMVTQFNEIPAKFQGEDALLISAGEGTRYSISRTKVPVTTPAENTLAESIVANFDTANPQLLFVERTCRQTGALRHKAQKELLLMEDLETGFAALYSQKALADRINADKILKKRADEFATFFKEERSSLKSYFSDEIAVHFDAAPASVMAYEIIEPAAISEKKPFEYKSRFSMNDFVKKAGNNYILEAGRLIGKIQKMEESERIRTMDVYRFIPSVYTWDVTIRIPAGYRLQGMDAMNKQVRNETGTLSSMATSDGTSVTIKVVLENLHYYETAENWPKILEVSDALYSLFTQKLLLEKID